MLIQKFIPFLTQYAATTVITTSKIPPTIEAVITQMLSLDVPKMYKNHTDNYR